MPVANLQSFRTLALRVKSTAFASQGHAVSLEAAVLQALGQRCSFAPAGGGQVADVVLDLNITGIGRGGGGFISNPNIATVDTLLVVSDGVNGELLGTAKIRGKSSGMIVNNNVPETQAIEIVAKTVADLLAKSGCSGPRIARVVEPPPPGPGSAGSGSVDHGGPPPVDETHRAEAEAINEDGKVKLRSADVPGARAAFQQAAALVPDARYEFNVCLTFEAEEQWDQAIATCKHARTMNPQPALMTKIDYRLEQYNKKHR